MNSVCSAFYSRYGPSEHKPFGNTVFMYLCVNIQ